MLNPAIDKALERVIRAYYGDTADARLAAVISDTETEDDLDDTIIAIMYNILRKHDSDSAQHYQLDVSDYWQAGDGSQAADCYRDRRGLWVVNGRDISREYSDWIDEHLGGK